MFSLKHLSRVTLTLGVIASLGLSYLPASATRAQAEEVVAETTTAVDFTGQLIELSNTTVPTVIVVRVNPTGEFTDYTIDITSETSFGSFAWNTTSMEDWMSGDSVRIIGEKNENTGVVAAEYAINQSINPLTMKGLNGWITAIDGEASTLTVQWMNVEHVVNVTDSTRLVISPNTEANLTDFQIGDRVRVRMNRDGAVENEARFVVALRRGSQLFLKARTRPFTAELNSIVINDDGSGSMQVTIGANDHLLPGDVNNLFGVEGDVKTVTFLDETKTVRRFMGSAEADEFVVGDKLLIVGRANDDGTISAYMIRDNDIWMAGVSTHTGTIISIDTSTNTIVAAGDNFRGEDNDITLTYEDDAKILIDGVEYSETDLLVGDTLRVRGVARLGDVLTINDVSIVSVSRE